MCVFEVSARRRSRLGVAGFGGFGGLGGLLLLLGCGACNGRSERVRSFGRRGGRGLSGIGSRCGELGAQSRLAIVHIRVQLNARLRDIILEGSPKSFFLHQLGLGDRIAVKLRANHRSSGARGTAQQAISYAAQRTSCVSAARTNLLGSFLGDFLLDCFNDQGDWKHRRGVSVQTSVSVRGRPRRHRGGKGHVRFVLSGSRLSRAIVWHCGETVVLILCTRSDAWYKLITSRSPLLVWQRGEQRGDCALRL